MPVPKACPKKIHNRGIYLTAAAIADVKTTPGSVALLTTENLVDKAYDQNLKIQAHMFNPQLKVTVLWKRDEERVSETTGKVTSVQMCHAYLTYTEEVLPAAAANAVSANGVS